MQGWLDKVLEPWLQRVVPGCLYKLLLVMWVLSAVLLPIHLLTTSSKECRTRRCSATPYMAGLGLILGGAVLWKDRRKRPSRKHDVRSVEKPADIDPSERDRLWREVDAELDRSRRARSRPRQPASNETWLEALLEPLIHIGGGWLTKLVLFVVVALALVGKACSG